MSEIMNEIRQWKICHPWRRWFAKNLDFLLLGVLPSIVLFSVFKETEILGAFGLIFPICIWILLESVFLSLFGCTPAKWLCAIRVNREDGDGLSFRVALKRTSRSCLYGFGLFLPFISLCTEVVAYNKLIKTGLTSWDSSSGTKMTYASFGLLRRVTVLVLVVGTLIFLGAPSFINARNKALQRTETEELVKHANSGDAESQYNLAVMYCNGAGVEQDYTEAARWYRKAAEQGHAHAQHNLGNRYSSGTGVEQDYTEAARWYRKGGGAGACLVTA